MFHAMFRDRRGVSEVIASLILILIVSVAGVLLYSYSLSALGSSSSYFQLETSKEEEKVRERFQITSVWWDISNQLNLTIFNHGKIEIAIDAFYINGTQVLAFLSGRGVAIGPREMVSVKFNSPVLVQGGQKYEVLAVTERGSRNAVYWKA
ncbi:hypothetical protein MUP59_01235 [Candidatus Bathyarchaeota archaeon]|nr:hypothetical protein [Candidatus Bathyarchaeota archaeon]